MKRIIYTLLIGTTAILFSCSSEECIACYDDEGIGVVEFCNPFEDDLERAVEVYLEKYTRDTTRGTLTCKKLRKEFDSNNF